MIRFQRILCPVDFSEFSARAYTYAYSLAKQYHAKLFVEHAVYPLVMSLPVLEVPTRGLHDAYQEIRASAQKQLAELTSRQEANCVETESFLHEGPASEAILQFAGSHGVDLIVMGTHGRQGLDHLTLGSITERVLRRAKCPVLAVRKPVHDFVDPRGNEPVHLKKILFCTDFSGSAWPFALSLAMEYNAELTLLHVLDATPSGADLESRAGEVTRELLNSVPADAGDWCTLKAVVRFGRPYQEIVQLALESQADVVVMGVRGRNALDLALFGSTTHRVLQLGSCPVLAVQG